MKKSIKKELKTIIKITIFVILIFAFITVAFVNILIDFNNNKIYNEYCKNLGYDTFERQGWTGDFCIGHGKAKQVYAENGKIFERE